MWLAVLKQVELLRSRCGRTAALVAQAGHFQTVAVHSEAVAGCDFTQDLCDGVSLELNQCCTFPADQMVVLRIPIVMLKDIAVFLTSHFTNQTRFFQLEQ